MARVLSFEFDKCNIKIIEADKKSETLSILRCMSVNIEHDVKNGKIVDVISVVDKINEIFRSNNLKTKKAAFVINPSNIMIRTIKLPLLKKNTEILSMIGIELQQHMSADLSMYKISYEISNITNENKVQYADYIVYCVPLSIIKQYTELTGKLNLNLIKIDIFPQCINELYKNKIRINDTDLNIDEVTAFINIKENFISFETASNGFCDFYIGQEIEKNYFYKVEEHKRPSACNGSCYLGDDRVLASQIIKFMRNYYSSRGKKSINKIYIYGVLSLEAVENIKNQLNMNIEIISAISNLTLNEEALKEFDLNIYFNPILSLLSQIRDKGIKTKSKKTRNKYAYAAILAIIMTASALLYGFISSYSAKNKIHAMISYDDENYNEAFNIIENLNTETCYLESAEKLRQIIKQNDYVDTGILKEINMSKPDGTKVTSTYSDKISTQLQCISPSMIEASLFFSNLREIERVESVYVPAIQSKKGETFSYSAVLKLKDLKENLNTENESDIDNEIRQDNIINVLSNISSEYSIELNSIKFSEIMPVFKDKKSGEYVESQQISPATCIKATVDFDSSLEKILNFVDSIKEHDGKISVVDISILSIDGQRMHTVLNLMFYAFPAYSGE